MSIKSESIKLQKKRQRKEAKRNLVRKQVRKNLNGFKSLGRAKQERAIRRARRTLGIKSALQNIANIIKRWSDKVSQDLSDRIDAQKVVLLNAMKSKDDQAIEKAVNDFVPLNQELYTIVEPLEKVNVDGILKDSPTPA